MRFKAHSGIALCTAILAGLVIVASSNSSTSGRISIAIANVIAKILA
jgi:hypothetical protein